MITFFHNNRCSKSREVLEILTKSKVPFQVNEYLKTPPTAAVLDSLLKQLKMEPDQIVRKGEDEYDSLKKSGKLPSTRKKWIELMVQNPILIERPIVSDGKSAIVGRPPEKVSAWLKSI